MTGTRARRASLLVVAAALAVAGLGFVALRLSGTAAQLEMGWSPRRELFFGWLWSFVFFASLALGALALSVTRRLCGGDAGDGLARHADALAATVPVTALGFGVVVMGSRDLYAPGLDEALFIGRGLACLVLWTLLARFHAPAAKRPGVRELAPVAAVIIALTASGAASDWLLSLEPAHPDTAAGLYLLAGGMAAAAGLLAVLSRNHPEIDRARTARLLLIFSLVWAAVALSRFGAALASADGDATLWLRYRLGPDWAPVLIAVVVAHLLVPLALALGAARRAGALAAAGALAVAAHLLDVYLAVMPALNGRPYLHWVDLCALLGLGGLLIGLYGAARRPPSAETA